MSYIPEKGDIVVLDFDPSTGNEIIKTRPAIVISRKQFNQHTGFAIVAPITSTIRNVALEVVIPETCTTKGAVLVHQLKSLDYISRSITFKEAAPKSVIDKVTEIAEILIK